MHRMLVAEMLERVTAVGQSSFACTPHILHPVYCVLNANDWVDVLCDRPDLEEVQRAKRGVCVKLSGCDKAQTG